MKRYEVPDPLYVRAREYVEKIWRCKIRRQHRLKMQSYGHCVRCGKRVEG